MNFLPQIRQVLLAAGIHTDPDAYLAVFTLATARFGAAAPLIPFLGSDPVPGSVLGALAALFAFVLCPSLSQEITVAPRFDEFLGLLLKEILVGTLIGLLVQIFFSAAEAVGTMAEYIAGLKQMDILFPQNPSASGPLSLLLGQAAIAIYLGAGVHLLLLRAIADSYTVLPLLAPMPTFAPGYNALAVEAGRLSGGFLTTALQIGAPVMFVLVFLRLASNLAIRMSVAFRDDPLQPIGSLAVFGVLMLGAGLIASGLVEHATAAIPVIRQMLLSLR